MGTVIIIGGGAAGLAAAIAAAECGDGVTILERMDRVGKKILATGNGRCNLMNTGEWRFPGGSALACAVLDRCGVVEQTRFWEHIGLRMRQEDGGRVYPVSGMASTVLDALRFSAEALGVEILTGVHVSGVFKARHGWTVMAGEDKWKADRVIVAGGGCAQPKLGSDGSAWSLLTTLGHKMVEARPALTQIVTDTAPIKGLSGVRARTSVTITNGHMEKYAESGELLFADYGVTGVCVMQCARYAAPEDTLHINLIRAMGIDSADEMRKELDRRRGEWGMRPQSDLFTGLCVPKLAQAIFQAAGLQCSQRFTCGELSSAAIDRLVAAAEDFKLNIRGVKGFDSAQVTAGGISTGAFKPETMESLLAPGVHAAGEVLDVDGDCGGFNLMFAFGSGILAGLNGRETPW
ncbi:MAG: aminoacetone oxidase family FAD-binding enzyme [Clostridiales bacterium]|nr:aminoacetone oxidase family FAD-binding enzyme [Clostridiales bacterium]